MDSSADSGTSPKTSQPAATPLSAPVGHSTSQGASKPSQFVLDALADAETVWLWSVRRPYLRGALREAAYYGRRAAEYTNEPDAESVSSAEVAAISAMVAARAAFRAVPGLRG